MKKLVVLFSIYLILINICLTSCKKECSGENPRARIINNSLSKADVQVKTTGGNTININNVLSQTSSPYSSFASGLATFTINAGSVSKVTEVTMQTCYDYDIKIDAANNITSEPIKR